MARVNWHDQILIQPRQEASIKPIGKGLHWAPAGKENIICKVAEKLRFNG